MKRYIYQWAVAGVLSSSLALTGCSSDYLDTTPTSATNTETAFSTLTGVKSAVNGIAKIMTMQFLTYGQGFNGEGYILSNYGNWMGQDYIYNYRGASYYNYMNQAYYMSNSSTNCNYPWNYYYALISNANSVIVRVDGVAGDENEKKFLKAQALTFRAYAYARLIQLYGHRWKDSNNGADPGVVLRLDESTGSKPLSTIAECYEQIYDDCKKAITLFTESGIDRSSGDIWLPNENVACAVLARAALTRSDYATALEYAKLAEEDHPLMSNDDYAGKGFAEPTKEWIFGSYGGESENLWYYSYGAYYACNGYYANTAAYGAGAIDKGLSDQIPDRDFRKSLFMTIDKFTLPANTTVATIQHTSYGYVSNNNVASQMEKYALEHVPTGMEAPYQYGRYYLGGQLKFWVTAQPGVSYIPFIRSSEMVLIEAEANYFLGKTEDAQAALIRLNKTSGRDTEYTCSKTGTDLFEEIVNYRGLELWGEGFGWFDYKRWGRDITRSAISKNGNAIANISKTIKAYGTESLNGWTYLIPTGETDYNNQVSN